MRKILSAIVITSLIVSCNSPATEGKKEDSATKMDAKKDGDLNFPFKALYSSSFEMGDQKNAKIVLDIWKAYQDDKLEDTKALWADTVTMQFASGYTFHGGRDSLIMGGKIDRSNYTSLIDSVDAWIPVRSTDMKEDWVCVWGKEYSVDKKGKKDTTNLQEIWRFKDGKIDYMAQYTAHHK